MAGSYLDWAWSTSSPLVAVWAAALFVLFKTRMDVPMGPRGLAMTVARCSFGVYVLHPVFANLLYKALGWASAPLPPVLFEAVTFLMVLLPALALTLALKRAPIVGRLL